MRRMQGRMIHLGNLDVLAQMSYERARVRRIAPTIDNQLAKCICKKSYPMYCDYGQINNS